MRNDSLIMSQQPEQPSPDSKREKHSSPAQPEESEQNAGVAETAAQVTSSPAQPEKSERKAGVAETAGQVTADCAAVCCCCSFGLINLLYLFFIKLPTGLLLRSARKIRRRARRCCKGSATTPCSCSSKTKNSALLYSFEEEIDACFEGRDQVQNVPVLVFDLEPTKEVKELEKEMWINFNNSGFGRSLSCRYE